MRVASRLIGIAVVLTAIGGVSRSSAQITAAALSGTVRDDAGATLQSAEVSVTNLETGRTRSVMTGIDGSYDLAGLTPGVYEAHASLAGFATTVHSGIPLSVGSMLARISG